MSVVNDTSYQEMYLGSTPIYQAILNNEQMRFNKPESEYSLLISQFIAASGVEDVTTLNALQNFYNGMTSASLWNKMYAIYPFVGDTSQSHGTNLKNPGVNHLQFFNTSSLTFTDAGYQNLSASGYALTSLTLSSSVESDFKTNASFAIYSRTAGSQSSYDMGTQNNGTLGNQYSIITSFSDGKFYPGLPTSITYSNSPGDGFYTANQNSNVVSGFLNGTKVTSGSQGIISIPTWPLAIGGIYEGQVTSISNRSNRTYGFSSYGKSLSDSEQSTFYTLVQNLQTQLNRPVVPATTTTTTTTTLPPVLNIEYLVVAGGGGSGTDNAGGGGAGGFISSSISVNYGSTLTAIVGAGGTQNNNGKNSSLISASLLSVVANGGGAGGGNDAGSNGGSGGGGSKTFSAGTGSASQGNSGGNGSPAASGGGGGASATGNVAVGNLGGNGGAGKYWLDGVAYAGGGGGGGYQTTAGGVGGLGGGGNATNTFNSPNTGSQGVDGLGGGGGGSFTGNKGGSGIIKIRYAGSQVATGGTITSAGGYTYHTFSSVGTGSFVY